MSIQAVTSTNEGVVPSGTLREAIEIRRVRGERYTMREAIAIVVPLCTHLAQLHAEGRRFFVHPSALLHGKAGDELDLAAAAILPSHARDRAVIAPECRKGQAGDAHATVFSLGAILYELVTGESVGPGMKRPREANPALPPSLEIILGKALVGDPKHRPHDIAALAQAFHHLAPAGSMPPPPADESHLDHDDGFDVDVSLSMLPPEPASGRDPLAVSAASNGTAILGPNSAPASQRQPFVAAAQAVPPSSRNFQLANAGPFTTIEAPRSAPNPADPTVQLAALKQKLESDPRPRYVVVKDGMDHGPFTAVELLQQIASHAFVGEHPLRDSVSGQERPIAEWQEFSLFAHQAGLNREIKQERKALEAVVRAERHRTQWKALVGATLLGLVVAAVVGYGVRKAVQASSNKRDVRTEDNTSTDSTAALSGAAQDPSAAKVGGGSYVGSGGGKFPQVGGGSCEAAQAAYVEDYTKSGTQPDLTVGAYAGVLNNGSYLNACGVPDNMSVSICAAVQNGRAVGITVTTNPSSPSVAGCIRGQVAGLGFPSNPRLDVARTTFAAVSK